ncbi:MAG: zinc metallopeptidase [Firmicutes bacterium]|nr:zinc metallopeptidase [Bacillota bacterium]
MRWQGERQSNNVEDRRSGGGRRMVMAGGGLGTLVLVVLIYLFGGNTRDVMRVLGAAPQTQTMEQGGQRPLSAEEKAAGEFAATVLGSTEDVWKTLFQAKGLTYRDPKMVLYSGYTRSGCGAAEASTGPFYCPADEKVYLDLSFLNELRTRFKAPGDFAAAYVIAHEVGHHVQRLLGVTQRVEQARSRLSEADYNRLSVRLELQADFLAGVWAHHAEKMRHLLEQGDLEEALNAASAVGDDRIQKMQQGYVVPDAFTHGTSAQRQRWFLKGFQTGDVSQGDTFAIREP